MFWDESTQVKYGLGSVYINQPLKYSVWCRGQHSALSMLGPEFDSQHGGLFWVFFFRSAC